MHIARTFAAAVCCAVVIAGNGLRAQSPGMHFGAGAPAVELVAQPQEVLGEQEVLDERAGGTADAAAPGEPLFYTQGGLVELALANNPTLAQARAEIQEAYGRRVQGGLYPNPRVGYVAEEMGVEGRAGQHGVFFEQEFVTGGKLRFNRMAAGWQQQQAAWGLTAQEYRVVNGVRQEYYAVLAAERRAALAMDLLDVASRGLEITTARFEREEGTRLDVLQAEVELEQAAVALEQAQAEYDSAWRRLAAVVGLPQLEPARLAGDIEEEIPDLGWETALARLLGMSPELGRARAGIEQARAALARARVEPVPNVTVRAGTSYDFADRRQIAALEVGIPIPIFDRNQGNIVAAQAELIRAAREAERVQLALQSALADAFRNYAVAREQVLRYRETILPRSQETLDLSRQLFDAGELTYLQLLTAQRTFTQASIQYMDALARLWQSVVAIDGLLLTDGLSAAPGAARPAR